MYIWTTIFGDVLLKIYKIRDKITGLFSSGGLYCKFNKTGKCWDSIKNIKLHLSLIKNAPAIYVEVVEYNLVESKVISVEDITNDI